MRFSIIINNYNYSRFIGQAIESALDQTHPDTEIVVVDDGSTDDSREVISSYLNRGIKPVFQANGGQASAFNAGFAASSGDLVLFLDSDDFLKPHAAATVVARWKPGIVAIYFRLEVSKIDGRKDHFIPDVSLKIPEGLLWPKMVEEGKFPRHLPPTSGDVFTREVLLECLPIPEILYRIDADGVLRTKVNFAGEVAAIQEALGFYRIHKSSTSSGLYVSLEKIRARMLRDMANLQLLHQGAARHGLSLMGDPTLNYYEHLRLRLMSICEDSSTHPVPEDRRLQLWWWTICSLKSHQRPLWKKILQGMQMTFLVLLPGFLVAPLNRLWNRAKSAVS